MDAFDLVSKERVNTLRPACRSYERLEKTQTYNLSLEASAHDLLAAVTSTRRAPVTLRVTGAGRGLIH